MVAHLLLGLLPAVAITVTPLSVVCSILYWKIFEAFNVALSSIF